MSSLGAPKHYPLQLWWRTIECGCPNQGEIESITLRQRSWFRKICHVSCGDDTQPSLGLSLQLQQGSGASDLLVKNRASYEDSHKREDKDVPGNYMPAGAKGAEKIMINKLVGQLKPPEFLHTLRNQ